MKNTMNATPAAPVTAMSEEKAMELLNGLIAKPDTKAEEIPAIWKELMAVHSMHFGQAPAAEPTRKRRRGPKNPNIGWPAGVKRADYQAWKDQQIANGRTENLNPQTYKAERDGQPTPTFGKQANQQPAPEGNEDQGGGQQDDQGGQPQELAVTANEAPKASRSRSNKGKDATPAAESKGEEEGTDATKQEAVAAGNNLAGTVKPAGSRGRGRPRNAAK